MLVSQERAQGLPAMEIQKVRYTHDAMIDLIIANPSISQNSIAEVFGYTAAWISIVVNSDAFRERLAERKGELVDPSIVASLEDKFKGLADRSLNVLLAKLEHPEIVGADVALKALDITARALNYGAKSTIGVQNNYVALLPPKAGSVEDWQRNYAPAAAPKIVSEQ